MSEMGDLPTNMILLLKLGSTTNKSTFIALSELHINFHSQTLHLWFLALFVA